MRPDFFQRLAGTIIFDQNRGLANHHSCSASSMVACPGLPRQGQSTGILGGASFVSWSNLVPRVLVRVTCAGRLDWLYANAVWGVWFDFLILNRVVREGHPRLARPFRLDDCNHSGAANIVIFQVISNTVCRCRFSCRRHVALEQF